MEIVSNKCQVQFWRKKSIGNLVKEIRSLKVNIKNE